MNLENIHLRGLRSAQPLATAVGSGVIYYVTDESVLERSNGISWQSYSGASGGSGSVNVATVSALDGDGTISTPLAVKVDGVGIGINGSNELESLVTPGLSAVNVTDALDGDGTIGTPLAVKVDGTTIGINGSNQLEALGGGGGGGSVIKTLDWLITNESSGNVQVGLKSIRHIPENCTIIGVRMFRTTQASLWADFYKKTYAGLPGTQTSADSICGGNVPMLANSYQFKDDVLTGWDTTLLAGDTLALKIDLCNGTTPAISVQLIVSVP